MVLLKSWRETNSRSWGLQHIVLPPPPLGHPFGGERGSPSWLPQRISELPEKEDFNKALES
jgi:hypothetical protein